MTSMMDYMAGAAAIILFLGGVALFRGPQTARIGGWLNIGAYSGAALYVLITHPPLFPFFLLCAALIGGAVGAVLARRVSMLEVPQMVAFQHGCGGAAAFLIAFAEYVVGGQGLSFITRIGSVSGIVIGAVTFSGSLVAAGKLANLIPAKPVHIARHDEMLKRLSAAALVLSMLALALSGYAVGNFFSIILIILSIVLGILYTIRIGGADMPVIISFFNATAGFAAAFVGVALTNYLLIGGGAFVAASGSLLTLSMCRAMNRRVLDVLMGQKPVVSAPQPPAEDSPPAQSAAASPLEQAAIALQNAKNVIIAPGYGMALSQAQEQTHQLETWLTARGAQVRYAIHPVAGRMPGHMNVLLAEVGVEYDRLFEMEAINEEFSRADLALVIGACDVVNPAASTQPDTPIAGMPILNVHHAQYVVVLNWDEKPGFSGVANPLYQMDRAILIWGDARENLNRLLTHVTSESAQTKSAQPASALSETSADGAKPDPLNKIAAAAAAAQNIIIAPGYGMALSQAQEQVHQLEIWLTARGAQVRYAIHPVAGRMPGHMNVLLAEVGVEYDRLFEMEAINEEFKHADLALVVGACDVVNPAASTQPDTPIAGMPILNVHHARTVAVFNWDEKPGFSGVANPLYQMDSAVLIWGDARENLNRLQDRLNAMK